MARQRKLSKPATRNERPSASPPVLKGWKRIAEFLGQPVNVAQRWAKSGMPTIRQGRFVTASAEELSRWLGRESGKAMPVHISAENEPDLSADLRRSLAAADKPTRKKRRK